MLTPIFFENLKGVLQLYENNTIPAYEVEGISVAFIMPPSMGDAIIAKKVFDVIIEVEKKCTVDLICEKK